MTKRENKKYTKACDLGKKTDIDQRISVKEKKEAVQNNINYV
jgi:hypothetical protein